jgi:hypothetical protein
MDGAMKHLLVTGDHGQWMGPWDTYQFQHTMGDGWVLWSPDQV